MHLVYKFTLSEKEIYVLASLMGKEFVTGITGRTENENRLIPKEEIRAIVNSLEKREWIRYDFNGVVAIASHIRYPLEILANPKSLLLISCPDDPDHGSDVYRFFSDSCSVESRYHAGTDRYEISVEKPISVEDYYSALLMCYKMVAPSRRSARIPASALLQVKELLRDNKEKAAREHIRQIIEDEDDADKLIKVIQGRYTPVIVKEYRRVGYRLVLMTSDILLGSENGRVRLRCENGNMVRYEIFG